MEIALAKNSLHSKAPWYEGNLFLSVVATVVAIVLTVVAAMKQDLRWLLLVAWALSCYPLWVISINVIHRTARMQLWVFCISITVVGLALLGLNSWLDPTHIVSDDELCIATKVFTQRLRTFDRERSLSLREVEKEAIKRIYAAKTEAERERLGKEKVDLYERWQRDFQYDYDTKFRPEAWTLRHQLLSRSPQQPTRSVITDSATFYNIGASGLQAVADRLDSLARTLCPVVETKDVPEKR